MEMLDALSQTFDHASKVVAGVRPDQLDAPTPCREWAVRDLLAHTTGVVINMGRGAAGRPLLPDVNGIALEGDVGTQFRAEADRTLAAWTARGLDGEVNIGAGPMPRRPASASTCSTRRRIRGTSPRDRTGLGSYPMSSPPSCSRSPEDSSATTVRSFAGFDPAV